MKIVEIAEIKAALKEYHSGCHEPSKEIFVGGGMHKLAGYPGARKEINEIVDRYEPLHYRRTAKKG